MCTKFDSEARASISYNSNLHLLLSLCVHILFFLVYIENFVSQITLKLLKKIHTFELEVSIIWAEKTVLLTPRCLATPYLQIIVFN